MLHKATFTSLIYNLSMQRERNKPLCMLLKQAANSFPAFKTLPVMKRIASHRNCGTDKLICQDHSILNAIIKERNQKW